MRVSGNVAIVEDRRYRDHRGPAGHPERPERLAAVEQAIDAFRDRVVPLAPRPAQPEEILRIHDRAHLERVTEAVRQAPQYLDADTYVSRESLDVALLAAGGAVELTRRVARGEARCGFAALRPPGHHAEPDRAMGFCVFNNAAIAARAVQCEERVGRILLLDFDVHHGNGTQHVFEADPTVLYVSTHQFPFYPGSGDFDEVGTGPGVGATVNVPMPAGCADTEYIGVLEHVLVPVARAFRPEMLIVSCGFDAHRDDPLGGMCVSGAGFRAMTDIIRCLADALCDGRAAFVLEGGYAASGLREGTHAVLEALLEAEPAQGSAAPAPTPGSVLARVLERVHQVHGRDFSRAAKK
ncbi:MAG: histone deacetylase [Myxococcales bacterium]|nr:histone deacetylase [Myxococcales bacterium]MDH5306627.1 histone deacetylase [Myxococcales bacterium]MDH5567247.1 histone deacetylase [Myxococcales bacterium]